MRRASVLLAGTLVVVVAAAACGGVKRLAYRPPPSSSSNVSAAAPVTLPDLAGVQQRPVSGSPPSTVVALGPGQATINGTVLGPSGPVAGATVEADRFVGGQAASTHATTAADGGFLLTGLLGGRWRVRAWLAPTLALTTPQIFFLAGTGTQTVTLTLAPYTSPVISSAISPSPPVEGNPVNVVVQVENPMVGSGGVVTYLPPAAAVVTLVGGSGWSVTSPNPAVTNGSGDAAFQMVCDTVGAPGLTASVADVANQVLRIPSCMPAPIPVTPPTTTTTTTPAAPTPPTSVPAP